MDDHFVDHGPNLIEPLIEKFFAQIGYVTTGICRLDPMLRFLTLTIGVRQFAFEMSFIATLGPCLANIGAD
jgi:hypothetical protein